MNNETISHILAGYYFECDSNNRVIVCFLNDNKQTVTKISHLYWHNVKGDNKDVSKSTFHNEKGQIVFAVVGSGVTQQCIDMVLAKNDMEELNKNIQTVLTTNGKKETKPTVGEKRKSCSKSGSKMVLDKKGNGRGLINIGYSTTDMNSAPAEATVSPIAPSPLTAPNLLPIGLRAMACYPCYDSSSTSSTIARHPSHFTAPSPATTKVYWNKCRLFNILPSPKPQLPPPPTAPTTVAPYHRPSNLQMLLFPLTGTLFQKSFTPFNLSHSPRESNTLRAIKTMKLPTLTYLSSPNSMSMPIPSPANSKINLENTNHRSSSCQTPEPSLTFLEPQSPPTTSQLLNTLIPHLHSNPTLQNVISGPPVQCNPSTGMPTAMLYDANPPTAVTSPNWSTTFFLQTIT